MEKKNKTRLARAAMTLLAMLCFLGGARAQVTVPYTEGFEDMNSADDLTAAGWISYGSQNGCILKIETSASNVHSGSKALDIDSWDASSSSAYQIVGLPVLDEPINGLQITFSYKVSTGTVDIGYLTDVNDATTFVSLKQFNNSSSYKTETVELNEAPATAARIAIKYSNYYRCYIDDIEVKDLPAFLKPTNLKVTSITSTSATLSWDSSGSGISYAYQYQEAGASDWSAETTINTTSVSLNGLTPGTTYNFQVKVKSGSDESDWATITFTTPCVSISLTDIPYTENFDSYTSSTGVLPDCWHRINTTTYTYYSTRPDVYNYNAHSSSNCLRLYSSYSSSFDYDPQDQYAILPPMENLAGKQITLQAKGYNTNSTFKIGTMTNPMDVGTFTEISTQSLTTSYQEFEYNIPSDATASYVAIMIEAATAERTTNCVYIDDIVIREAPSCLKPTDLNSTNITENSAELSWTAGGSETEWTIYYKKTTDENYIEVTDVTENPYTLEGLNAATTYQFYVVANCSDTDTSDPSSVYSFTTDCGAIASLPWTENFDSYTGSTSSSVPSGYPNDEMPICWRFLNRSETSSTYPLVFISSNSGYPVSGKCLFFRSSKDTPLYAVLPTFEDDIAGLQLTFTYRNEGTSDSNGTLIVGYMTDPTDATTFTAVQTCDRTTTLTEKEVMFTDAPTGSYIAFMYQGGSSDNYYLSIDNVKVDYIPSCIKPTGLTVSNVTAHEASISWTSEANAWQIQVGDEDPISVTTNPYTLTGLVAETAYSVKVRTNCGGTYSEWTNPVSFTTTIACPTPTVNVSDITATTAVVSCTNTEAEHFNVMLGEVVIENVTMPYTLTELEPSTSYTVKVKALCGVEDGESEWSNGTTFMTADICPDGMVCIGTGTNTSYYLPTNNYYNYGLTQQIYTADEIGEAGAILSIDFYKASETEMVKNLDIYIVSTTKDEFTSNTDWIPVTANDLVYSGTVTFADNAWTTIELDNPFIYDGTSNLCIVVDNNTGNCKSNTPLYVFATDGKNQAIYQYSDSNNFDPTSAAPGTAIGRMTSKNRIRLRIGEPPSCPKPTGLAVNYEGGATATVTWNGEASAYNIDVNGTVTNNVTSPYTLGGLELATTYEIKVQADCGSGGTSEWTNPVSFTTDLCLPENMCKITIKLTDSYGDGWNGGKLEVVDALTEALLGTYTISNSIGEETFELNVCDGREINFVYTQGNYPTENGWLITDINDEVIDEHEGCSNGCAVASGIIATYTVNCYVDPCRKPNKLAASDIEAMGANLSWKGAQESYNIRYRQPAVSTNLNAPATIILTAGDVWGDNSGYQMLLDADATAYGTIIPESGALTSSGDASEETYAEFEYKIPANADGALTTENIVFNNSISIDIPAGTYDWCITNPSSGDRMWIVGSGDVPGRYDNFVFEPGVTYEFSMQMFGDGDGAAFTVTPMSDWITVGNVTSPYELSGLTPSTPYEFQVQGISSVCDDGVTEWSEPANFITTGEPLKFAAEGYATYYNSQNDVLLPAGMKALIVTLATATSADDATLEYETIADGNTGSNVVHAGNAMVLQVAPAEAARTISIGLDTKTTGSYTGNKLHGSDTRVDITTLADYSADDYYYYMLSYDQNGENIGWYWDKENTNGTGFWSEAHKAWLALPRSLFSDSAPFLGLPGWEDTTGIVPVGVNPEDGEWYTLQGLKIGKKPTTAGVYIHNGKKFVIK